MCSKARRGGKKRPRCLGLGAEHLERGSWNVTASLLLWKLTASLLAFTLPSGSSDIDDGYAMFHRAGWSPIHHQVRSVLPQREQPSDVDIDTRWKRSIREGDGKSISLIRVYINRCIRAFLGNVQEYHQETRPRATTSTQLYSLGKGPFVGAVEGGAWIQRQHARKVACLLLDGAGKWWGTSGRIGLPRASEGPSG